MSTPNHIVFVHGWSVHHTDTYGELPERLAKEIPGATTHHLHLGKYISFRDEVRMNDIAKAMEAAVRTELKAVESFAVITHSTGGPVVRTWWNRYYIEQNLPCPMTHVVHLAAAHFGSALAQLGKGTLGRLKAFTEGIEPGQGILDWLELGSIEAWRLDEDWIRRPAAYDDAHPVYSFALVGQAIDRSLYDNLNPYTGELGSDGVVRTPAANLNATYVKLIQKAPTTTQLERGKPSLLEIAPEGSIHSAESPFALVPATSHSGSKMGIMRSVTTGGATPPVVRRIKECLSVDDAVGYLKLAKQFVANTGDIIEKERVEIVDRRLFRDRVFIHDTHSMLIIRIRDEEGYTPGNFRILFTGEDNDPNKLPEGFLVDTQRNKRDPGALTFFFNFDRLHGCEAVYREMTGRRRKKIREALPPLPRFGIKIEAFPDEGFAHYHPCEAAANPDLLHGLIRANETTLVEIVLKRIVHRDTFAFSKDLKREEFKNTKPGPALL